MKMQRNALAAIGLLATSLSALLPVRQLPPSPRNETPALALASPVEQRGVRDRAELEAFVDGIMVANLRDKHVAGATIAVVKDGALLFTKGYGYADVARRRPIDAERSLFRIGSTSKLFTWTAVMQLVEQGKLDLDAGRESLHRLQDPSDILPQPITLRHIMTHTPGFEEDGRDLISDDSTTLVLLVLANGSRVTFQDACDRPARLHRTPTTPRRSPATSCSVRPECLGTTTSSSECSCRSA